MLSCNSFHILCQDIIIFSAKIILASSNHLIYIGAMKPWSETDLDEYLKRTGLTVPDFPDTCAEDKPKVIHKLGRGRRVEVDSYKFASQAEASRYLELKLLQQAGKIVGLEPHPYWNIEIKGVHVCRVVADFLYWEQRPKPRLDGNGEDMIPSLVVEDIKSERIGKDGKVKFTTDTRISKIGRKLLFAQYGVEVKVLYR